MKTTSLVLIRHGMTAAVGRRLTGRLPGIHLDAVGRAQADAAAARLAAVPVDGVVSSPLERALQTAAPIAAAHGLQVDVDPALAEFDVGDWAGAAIDSLTGVPAWDRFNAVRSLTRPPRGETMLEVQQRAVAALLARHEQQPGRTIVAVSHGDVIRAVLLFFLGMPLDFCHRLEIAPARITVVRLSDSGPVVSQVNGDSVQLPA